MYIDIKNAKTKQILINEKRGPMDLMVSKEIQMFLLLHLNPLILVGLGEDIQT